MMNAAIEVTTFTKSDGPAYQAHRARYQWRRFLRRQRMLDDKWQCSADEGYQRQAVG
jgi:hypothetical protein